MVIAYHTVFAAYGFWLPNDPRGSWSEFVGAWELLRFGKATRLTTRTSVANRPHDADLRARAKAALKYPPVEFNGVQARGIARGFARYVEASGIVVLACAILPNHVYFVIRRADRPVEGIVNHLRAPPRASSWPKEYTR